jgi:hypothetical protein
MKRFFFVLVFLFGACDAPQTGISCTGKAFVLIDHSEKCTAVFDNLIGSSRIYRAVINVFADWYNSSGDYTHELQGASIEVADNAPVMGFQFPVSLTSDPSASYRMIRAQFRFYRTDGTISTRTAQIAVRY